MPKIQEAVRDFFGKEPSKNVHPDEAVALGAAIQGSSLVDADQEVLLLDVTPHSLGIMVHGGGFERLIEANTTIPTSHSHTFTTVRDNQTSVKIVVLQGDSDVATENELLGEFMLTGLRGASAGVVQVEVAFSISADGIVSVSARDLETNKEQSITVTSTSGLTEHELSNMIQENQDYLVALKEDESIEKDRARLNRLLRDVEKSIAQADASGAPFADDLRIDAENAVQAARQQLSSRSVEDIAAALQNLERAQRALKVYTEG
jgi:molecular chaperone DnaK